VVTSELSDGENTRSISVAVEIIVSRGQRIVIQVPIIVIMSCVSINGPTGGNAQAECH